MALAGLSTTHTQDTVQQRDHRRSDQTRPLTQVVLAIDATIGSARGRAAQKEREGVKFLPARRLVVAKSSSVTSGPADRARDHATEHQSHRRRRGFAANGEPYVYVLHLRLGPASSSRRTSPATCLPQSFTLGATCGILFVSLFLPGSSDSCGCTAFSHSPSRTWPWQGGRHIRFWLGDRCRPPASQLVNSQCTFCLFLIGKSSSQVFTYPAIYTE